MVKKIISKFIIVLSIIVTLTHGNVSMQGKGIAISTNGKKGNKKFV
jgi:hypothetical protein